MTAYPAWTPASRPGIIPLHPLGFGTILGRSFVALRQNPRVLLGFALVVQTVAYLLVLLAIAGVAFAAFSRLDTLRPGTDEFETVMAGSIAITAIAGIVLGLGAGALSVIVQGIVVTEVAHAAVAEKLTLGGLWQQVRPVIWRLLGYSFLLILAILVGVGVAVLAMVSLGLVAGPIAIVFTILLILAAIPLVWWLSTKLLLVPAAIILENASIGQAIARSWRLIRGRFWVALGVILVISLTFGAVGQVISIPFTFLSTGLTTIIAPTGAADVSAIIGILVVLLLTQIVTLLIQSVAIVVQSTATAILYIDCRMRHEGLDLDLLAYIERRDAGATALADPYREHIGRVMFSRFPAYPTGQYPPAQTPYPQPEYAKPRYPQPGYPQPGYPHPAAYPPPPASASPYGPAPQPVPPAPAAPAEPPPTQWAAPGGAPDDSDRQSPWA